MLSETRNPHTAQIDLGARLAGYAALVRAEIEGALAGAPELRPFYGMMAYHIGLQDRHFEPAPARAGKSLRPSLCLLLAEGLGVPAADCAALAAGIEVLHNFSLVHDDIEDRSSTRRGRPTVWSLWGEAQAINTGDGMFALAHKLWLSSPIADKDPAAFIDIARSLERAILVLCEGQFLDISGEGNLSISSGDYVAMIARKTASLIGEAAWVGCRAATADAAILDRARAFGSELGLAFQIRDDLLGIWGDEMTTGKSTSSDIATRKMTLPVILALESPGAEQARELPRLYSAAPQDEDDSGRVRDLLDALGSREAAMRYEEVHWSAAMDALEALPLAAAWRETVRDFARSFVDRAS